VREKRHACGCGPYLIWKKCSFCWIRPLPHLTFAPVADASRHGQLVFLCDTDGDGLKEEIATLPLHAKYGVDALAPPNIFERILAFLRRIFS
jgi:hypothetical protein